MYLIGDLRLISLFPDEGLFMEDTQAGCWRRNTSVRASTQKMVL
jgi:hypothetical protein